MTQVTVIIPNYNGEKLLPVCLSSLMKQTYAQCGILVVDNGSTDGSAELIRRDYPSVRLLKLDRNYGFSAAVNRGIAQCDTPYVILLNNDTKAEPTFVEELVRAIEKRPDAFSCQAKMMDFQNPSVMDDAGDFFCAMGWAFAGGRGKSEQLYEEDAEIFSACAGAAICRRSAFLEVGLFDEKHFAYLEDIDLGYRARLWGYRNYFAHRARVYHMGSATSGERHNAFKVRLSAQNSIYVCYKNMTGGQLALNALLLGLGILIKQVYFQRKGLGREYREGLKKGFALCKKENKPDMDRAKRRNAWKLEGTLLRNIGRRVCSR